MMGEARRQAVRFTRRGKVQEVTGFRPDATLLDYLRLVERSTGAKSPTSRSISAAASPIR